MDDQLTNAETEVFRTAAKRFEEFFQNLPIACFGFDNDCIVIDWNRAGERLLSRSSSQISGKCVFDLLCGDGQADLLGELFREVLRNNGIEAFDWQLTDPFGVVRYLQCSCFPLHRRDGTVSGGVIALVDITAQKESERQIEDHLLRLNEYSMEIEQSKWELEQANRQLEALAATDGLTGLLNHRAFQETLAREIKRAEREVCELSIVLMDVDRFKSFNDEFGHPAGDRVLTAVADLLGQCARGSDAVARYGGEEFAVILPLADLEGAVVTANRMREAIEQHAWLDRPVTASFGVARWHIGMTQAQLIELADQALYAAKAAGRNQVLTAADLPKAA